MKKIFVNLKRFDVPRSKGGICNFDNSKEWIEWIIGESIKAGLGKLDNMDVTFLLPESLIKVANDILSTFLEKDIKTINIGCQGIFREDVKKGGNFGAFTTNLPAAAASSIGCSWAIIGHSEERKDKVGIISKFDPLCNTDTQKRKQLSQAVNSIMNEEVLCAMDAGIKVLFCIGETADEKGTGEFEEQKPRIEAVLREQLLQGLKGVQNKQPDKNIVIGYEPIWAIGPGKTPPGAEYIGFVSAYIKSVVKKELGFEVPVVYGGGLKEENAGMISQIETIDGGLVALTKFTGEIGFFPEDLKIIINKYLE